MRRKVEKLEMKLSNINDHDDDQDDDGEEVSESFVFNTKREGMIIHIRLIDRSIPKTSVRIHYRH